MIYFRYPGNNSFPPPKKPKTKTKTSKNHGIVSRQELRSLRNTAY